MKRNIAVDFVLGDIGWLGQTRTALKSDSVPAVLALVSPVGTVGVFHFLLMR